MGYQKSQFYLKIGITTPPPPPGANVSEYVRVFSVEDYLVCILASKCLQYVLYRQVIDGMFIINQISGRRSSETINQATCKNFTLITQSCVLHGKCFVKF